MTRWSCGCILIGSLTSRCAQHIDWMCHGGQTNHLQPEYQPNLGECPVCYFEGMIKAHKEIPDGRDD